MEKFRVSDLDHKPAKLILVQPTGAEREDIETIDFAAVLKATMNLQDLCHVGVLSMYDSRTPLEFRSCGGNLKFSHLGQQRPGWTADYVDQDVLVTCSNPGCQMELVSYIKRNVLSELLFHLMIKQMIPQLPAGNYFDCGQTEYESWCMNNWASVKSLGLVSLLDVIFRGYMDRSYYGSFTDVYGLAFTIKVGLNTKSNLGGYDRWLQFLCVQKMLQEKKVLERMKFSLFGPKPNTTQWDKELVL